MLDEFTTIILWLALDSEANCACFQQLGETIFILAKVGLAADLHLTSERRKGENFFEMEGWEQEFFLENSFDSKTFGSRLRVTSCGQPNSSDTTWSAPILWHSNVIQLLVPEG
jgi:hypothetical protein